MSRIVHLVLAETLADRRWLDTLLAIRQADDRVVVSGYQLSEIVPCLEALTLDGARPPHYLQFEPQESAGADVDVDYPRCPVADLSDWILNSDQVVCWP